MKSAFAFCFLKIMQIKFAAYFTENNIIHIYKIQQLLFFLDVNQSFFFSKCISYKDLVSYHFHDWDKNLQFFPFACMALVKRGDNGEFHKQIKMRDIS